MDQSSGQLFLFPVPMGVQVFPSGSALRPRAWAGFGGSGALCSLPELEAKSPARHGVFVGLIQAITSDELRRIVRPLVVDLGDQGEETSQGVVRRPRNACADFRLCPSLWRSRLRLAWETAPTSLSALPLAGGEQQGLLDWPSRLGPP